MFSTKLNAVLYIKWEKKIWDEIISVKWRDIYDLFWYLNNWLKPNIDCIEWVSDIISLKENLKDIINKIDFKEVVLDVENFLEDENFLEFIKNNWKEYVIWKINEM